MNTKCAFGGIRTSIGLTGIDTVASCSLAGINDAEDSVIPDHHNGRASDREDDKCHRRYP